MLFDSVERYREEIKLGSQRLYALKEEFRELGVPLGTQILDRLESRINGLETKLPEAKRKGTGTANLESKEFEGAWNELHTDFELLELKLLDAKNTKKEKA